MNKVTLKEIHVANINLAKLVSLDNDFLLARGLAKLIQAIDTDVKLIEKTRKEIFDKYADGDNIPAEKTQEFIDELDKFLDTEVELDFQPIKESLLQDIKLSAREYMALSPFLKEDKPLNIKKKK